MQFENEKFFSNRRLWWCVLLSIIFHVLFFWIRSQEGLIEKKTEEEEKPIEITQVPPQSLPPQKPTLPKATEMAETTDANNRKLDPNAKVLSDHTQTVEKQTRAKAIDDFRKKQGTGMKSQSTEVAAIPPTGEQQKEKSTTEKPENTEGDQALPKEENNKTAGIKRDWKTLSLKDLSVGDGAPTAASDDHLKDYDSGEDTVLSTREYRYFSYYTRIKELLRQYWKPNVEQRLYKMWAKGRSLSDDEIVTKILVLLNDNGQIQKISRIGSCGFAELDEAAVEAFQRAAPFPNPPKGIIEADGFVRIRWDFILKTEASPRIQFRNVGSAPP